MLYQIQKKDIDKAAKILAKSFIDYPIFKFVFPDEQYRKNKIHHLFSFFIKLGMLRGEVFASSKNIEAVSIWLNPDVKLSLLDYLKAGIIFLKFKIDRKSIKRFSEIGLTKKKNRSNILNNNYCLLDVIGVDPQFQKKGFARLLVESKLIDTDKLKIPCYVETSNQENIPFYERFGFKLIHEYELMSLNIFCLYRNHFK